MVSSLMPLSSLDPAFILLLILVGLVGSAAGALREGAGSRGLNILTTFYLTFFVAGAFGWAVQHHQTNSDITRFLLLSIYLLPFTLLILYFRRSADVSISLFKPWVLSLGAREIFTILLLIPLAATFVYQLFHLPAFGWDSLDWWYASTYRYIAVLNYSLCPSAWANIEDINVVWRLDLSQTCGETATRYDSALSLKGFHPPLLPWSFGAAITIFQGKTVGAAASLIGIVPAVMAATVLYRSTILAGGGTSMALLSILAFLSLPIFENHLLISGYSELWVAATLLLLLAYTERRQLFTRASSLLIITSLLSVLVLIRNTGLLDALIFCSSAVMAIVWQRYGLRKVIIAGAILVLFAYSTFDWFSDLGAQTVFRPGQAPGFPYFYTAADNAGPLELLKAIGNALIIKSSFSVIPFTWAVITLISFLRAGQTFTEIMATSFVLLKIAFLGWLYLLSPYFAEKAAIDTGLTRYLIPVAAVMLFNASITIPRIIRS